MRILYFSDNHPSLSSFILQDVNRMSKIHEVCYVYTSQYLKKSNTSFNTKYIYYPSRSWVSRIKWYLENKSIYLNWYNRLFSRKLNEFINDFKPTLIHCQFAYEGLKLFDNFDNPNISIVINFRGYDASSKLKNPRYVDRLKEILSRENVHSIFVCNFLKENLINKGIIFKNKPNIIYTGVDLSKFKIESRKNRITSINPKKFNIVQTGSFGQKKGHFYTIQAYYKYLRDNPDSDKHLSFIGDGTYLEDMQNLVKQMGIEKKVSFLGNQKHNFIVNALEYADAFIHHSITAENGDQEGIPNAIIEAMAMKLPILGSIHSGIPEAIEHGVNGLLCEEKNIDSLALQIEQIAEFKKNEINREKVKQQFSLDSHIENILNVYRNCLNN